jgi:hypothetical protein
MDEALSLGSWFKGKREELKQNAIQQGVDRGLAALDSWGAKKWPIGWIRVRRMGVGWKTIGGVLLMYAPDILEHVPVVAYAFGLDDAQAKAAVEVIGKGLLFLGLADKYLKFTKPIERRQGERVVTSESGAVYVLSPVSSAPTAPTQPVPDGITPEAKVVFDNVITAETKKGAPIEVARTSALDAVEKVKPK